MSTYEYKTIAAPRRAPKTKGVKGKDALAARAVEDVLREECVGGWEYLRADSFQFEEAGGIFAGKETVTRTMLIFRRPVAATGPHKSSRPQPDAQPATPVAAQPAAAPPPPPIGGVERG